MNPDSLRKRMRRGCAVVLPQGEFVTWEEFCEVQQAGLAHADAWDGMLLHAHSHDCTFYGPDPHGQEQTWESLTDEQRAWWIAQAKEVTP
jgi:hypothetical protein